MPPAHLARQTSRVRKRTLPSEPESETESDSEQGRRVEAHHQSAAAPESSPVDVALARIAAAHGSAIDPGLERLRAVATRAGLHTVNVPVAIVAGTNGKGSTVACLESIWRMAGRRTGAFTSPHLIRFNERIRVDGEEVSDEAILAALDRVSAHIAPDTLTYFEAAALAAMACFEAAACDAVVLEVGLGGRLDAANLWDADGAILTSVALDHAEWLGTDLSVIATEKAAVARRGGVLVVGEQYPPASLAPWAREQGVELVSIDPVLGELAPLRQLAGEHHRRNAACAVTLARRLDDLVPITSADIQQGLDAAYVPGRMQALRVATVDVVVDVAHNPAAAEALALALAPECFHIVFASLLDKDIDGIARALIPMARSVACATVESNRAMDAQALAARVQSQAADYPLTPIDAHASVDAAWQAASLRARSDAARALVVGSHVTVGAWLRWYGMACSDHE